MPARSVRKPKKLDVHYATIRDFFDAFSLVQSKKYLLSAMKAAERKKVWKKADPAELLYFFEQLDKLIPAAVGISGSGIKIKNADHFSGRKGKELLKTILHYSLSSNSISESGEGIKVLETYILLKKLLKDCYLLNVEVSKLQKEN